MVTSNAKRFDAEKFMHKLRESDVLFGWGLVVKAVIRQLMIRDQTYHHVRKEYGGLTDDPAKRFKEIDAQNARLKKPLAEALLGNV